MAVWDTIVAPVIAIINKVIPDRNAADAAVAALKQLDAAGELDLEKAKLISITSAQSDVNKVEAGTGSLFVSGWRPGIGWVCAIALFFQYIVRPLVQWGFSVTLHPIPVLPGLDDNLWQLMFGMLGMGVLRTAEKMKGVASQ